jgi:carbohydrate-selective porin OprB
MVHQGGAGGFASVQPSHGTRTFAKAPPVDHKAQRISTEWASYIFRQYIVERGRKDGWSFSTQIAFANKDTSPVTKFFNAGIGGNGLIKSRNRDEFGLAYAYTDLSSDLKDNINLVTLGEVRLRPEHQVEVFYNLFITPWLQLTGDLQIIRGVRPSAETAIVPGGRIVMIS